jgi:hypothetical protein
MVVSHVFQGFIDLFYRLVVVAGLETETGAFGGSGSGGIADTAHPRRAFTSVTDAVALERANVVLPAAERLLYAEVWQVGPLASSFEWKLSPDSSVTGVYQTEFLSATSRPCRDYG